MNLNGSITIQVEQSHAQNLHHLGTTSRINGWSVVRHNHPEVPTISVTENNINNQKQE